MAIDIDEAKVEHSEVGLWFGWTLTTAGEMLLGFLPTFLLVNVLNLGLAQIIVPVLAGTIIGFAQWLALRRYITASSPWILADGISWSFGYISGLFLIQVLPSTVFAGFIGYFLFGVIVANALAWATGFWASQFVLPLFFHGPSIEPALSTTVIAVTSGLVGGAVTGIALIWIGRRIEVA